MEESGHCPSLKMDTRYVPAVDQILGGLEFAHRKDAKRTASRTSRCQQILSDCQALAQENEERSAQGARRAHASLIRAACGEPEREWTQRDRSGQEGSRGPTPMRHRSPDDAFRGGSVDPTAPGREVEVLGAMARSMTPATSSTAVPSARTWVSGVCQEQMVGMQGIHMSAASPAHVGPRLGHSTGRAQGVPGSIPTGAGICHTPQAAVASEAKAMSRISPRPPRSVSPMPRCHATPVVARTTPQASCAPAFSCASHMLARSVSPMPRSAGLPTGGVGVWMAATPSTTATSMASCTSPTPCAPQSALGCVSPLPSGAVAVPWQVPVGESRFTLGRNVPMDFLQVPMQAGPSVARNGVSRISEFAVAAQRAMPILVYSPHTGNWSPMPHSSSSLVVPVPTLQRQALADPEVAPSSSEVPLDVAAFVSMALRGQAVRQLLSCLRVAAHRRIGCALGRWWRSTAMVVVGESSTTGMLARLATYDRTWHHRDHLHSLLASAVAAEGRKVAYHERTLAILLGLRQLHACLHMWDHIVLRSALKRLKFHCTDAASRGPLHGAPAPSARGGNDTPVPSQADPVAALQTSSQGARAMEVADSTMSLAQHTPSTNKPKKSSSWCPPLRFMRLPDRQDSYSPQSSAAPGAPEQLQSYPELLVPSASMDGVQCSKSIADSIDVDNQDLFPRSRTPVQLIEGLHSAVIRALSETSSSWDSAQTIPNVGGQAVHSSSMRPSVEPSAHAESLVLQRNQLASADLQVSCNVLAASSSARASLSTRAIDTSALDEAVDVAGGPLSVSMIPGVFCAVVSANIAARASKGSAEQEAQEVGYVHENADSRRSSSIHGPSHYTAQRLPVSLRQVAQRRTAAAVALGVSKDAGRRTIRQAFRQNALQLHPDKGGSSVDFQVLNEAYRKMAYG